jgi:hypothetical protein
LTEEVTSAQARKSALLVAAVFAALAGWEIFRHRPTFAAVLGLVTLAILACAASQAGAMWFYRWWMRLASAIGFVNSRVLLAVLFYLLIAPVGVLVRLFGHDPLQRRRKKSGDSYWVPRAHARQSKQDYEHSF